MRETDVAIVGGGLAGSTAAAMLGRAGIAAIMIDPHETYPADFRCEKLDASQIEALTRTGLAEPILAAGTMDDRISIVRGGRIVDRKPRHQCNILYDTMVNTMRAQIPAGVERILGKVNTVVPGTDRQTLTLSTGETISARLMVFANGLNIGLRHGLGIGRQVLSENHSISIGFDIAPVGAADFDFKALTYFGERPEDRLAYLSLFRIGDVMRANLFVYREQADPWIQTFRKAPEEALVGIMPRLRHVIGDFRVSSFVKIRPVDLVVTTGHVQPGLVLVGDAFSTSCPAAGTGCNKVFTDVERLCNEYVPRWLATPGMGRDKIAAFYTDPVKVETETASREKAYRLRALSTEKGLAWSFKRHGRIYAHLMLGLVRRAREGLGRHHRRPATAAHV